MQRDKLTADPK